MTRQHAHVDQQDDAAGRRARMAHMSLMRGTTQYHALSGAAVQVSACHARAVPSSILLGVATQNSYWGILLSAAAPHAGP